MRGSMTNEEQEALINAKFGNIDESLGIAVTDRATGQIRQTLTMFQEYLADREAEDS